MQSNLNKPVWPSSASSSSSSSSCYPNSDQNSWSPAMDASQYPGYPSNYWYPQSHSTGHYASPTYPAGTEGQPAYNPQAMAAAYPSEHGHVYSPGQGQYSASSFHPSNPFYCADHHQMPQRQAAGPYPGQGAPPGQYPGQGAPPGPYPGQGAPPGPYPGQGAPPGPYPGQGAPSEQHTGGSVQPHSQHHHQHHPHYPGPHCQGGPGYPPASYPHYSEGGHSHSMPPNPAYPSQGQCVHPRANAPYPSQGQCVHPRAQTDGWPSHQGGYAAAAPPVQQGGQWPPGQPPPPQNHHYGPPVRPAHPPAWPGTGTGAPPPYQPKDQQHQRAPQVGPRPRPAPSPNPPNGNKPAEFSSPPQMYSRTGAPRAGPTEPNGSQADPPPPHSAQAPAQGPASAQGPAQPQGPPQPFGPAPAPQNYDPGLYTVEQVMARTQLLEEDVDEFVGRKSDKSYRYLEELLTKELLLLDSVETRGLDAVRTARKEAVQRIQAILDRLEKKAF